LSRGPPPPPPFPYTTLFRSGLLEHAAHRRGGRLGIDRGRQAHAELERRAWAQDIAGLVGQRQAGGTDHRQRRTPGAIEDRLDRRSEEHTSELQSRENLVCRL